MNSTNREDDRYAQVSTHNNARYRDLSGWTSYVADNGVQSVDPSGFTGPTNFPAGTNPFSVTMGDFNGDGDADLAVRRQPELWQRLGAARRHRRELHRPD